MSYNNGVRPWVPYHVPPPRYFGRYPPPRPHLVMIPFPPPPPQQDPALVQRVADLEYQLGIEKDLRQRDLEKLATANEKVNAADEKLRAADTQMKADAFTIRGLKVECEQLNKRWEEHVKELRKSHDELLDKKQKEHDVAYKKKHAQYENALKEVMKYAATCAVVKEYGAQLAAKRLEEEKKEKETEKGN